MVTKTANHDFQIDHDAGLAGVERCDGVLDLCRGATDCTMCSSVPLLCITGTMVVITLLLVFGLSEYRGDQNIAIPCYNTFYPLVLSQLILPTKYNIGTQYIHIFLQNSFLSRFHGFSFIVFSTFVPCG